MLFIDARIFFVFGSFGFSRSVILASGTVLHGAIHPRIHHQVNHQDKEFGRYENGLCITTNSVERFFSLLKRAINGTYYHVSPQHLHRYLNEFDFKYSNRKIMDGERSCKLIGKTAGKRLMYRDLIPERPTFSQSSVLALPVEAD